MTTGDVRRQLARTRPPYAEHDRVAYSCPCGWLGDWFPLRYEALALGIVREHLADEHGAELGAGRCAECGAPTDYLRAGGIYLCAQHAPTPEEWQLATGAATHDG